MNSEIEKGEKEQIKTEKEQIETEKEEKDEKEQIETEKEEKDEKEQIENEKEEKDEKEQIETEKENQKKQLKWDDYSLEDIVQSTYTYLSENYEKYDLEEYLSLKNKKKYIESLKSNVKTQSYEKLIEYLMQLKDYVEEIYLSSKLSLNEKTELIKNTTNNLLNSNNLKHTTTYLNENTNFLINKINEIIKSIKEYYL